MPKADEGAELALQLMTIDIDAVYANGILTLKDPVDLPGTPSCT